MNNTQENPTFTIQDVLNGKYENKMIELADDVDSTLVYTTLILNILDDYFSGEIDMGYNQINEEEKNNLIQFIYKFDQESRCSILALMLLKIILSENKAKSSHSSYDSIAKGHRLFLDKLKIEDKPTIKSIFIEELKSRGIEYDTHILNIS